MIGLRTMVVGRQAVLAVEEAAGSRSRLLRAMYGVNVIAAGLPGLATVIAPDFAARYMFGAAQDPVALRMLGAVWLSVGVLSLVGFRHPLRFSAVFPVEALYKSVWLATAAPTIFSGERPELKPMAALFAAWVAADLAVTPWAYLLGPHAEADGRLT